MVQPLVVDLAGFLVVDKLDECVVEDQIFQDRPVPSWSLTEFRSIPLIHVAPCLLHTSVVLVCAPGKRLASLVHENNLDGLEQVIFEAFAGRANDREVLQDVHQRVDVAGRNWTVEVQARLEGRVHLPGVVDIQASSGQGDQVELHLTLFRHLLVLTGQGEGADVGFIMESQVRQGCSIN